MVDNIFFGFWNYFSEGVQFFTATCVVVFLTYFVFSPIFRK